MNHRPGDFDAARWDKNRMVARRHPNDVRANILGGIVVLVAAGLGIASLIEVAGTITGG